MRDLFVFSLVLLVIVPTLVRPQIGLLSWLWISIMNPHRMAYGWLYDAPLLDLIGAATLISCAIHWQTRASAKMMPIISLLIVFYFWTTLTMLFGVDITISLTPWVEFSKTMLMVALLLLFMNKKHWIIAAIAVFTLSIAMYAIKGGVFTIATGGGHRVWGPPTTAWGDNNGVSVAMLMIIPLCFALRSMFSHKLYRSICLFCAFCALFALLGTQSRGALVGLMGMVMIIVLRSRFRLRAMMLVIVLLPVGFTFMPSTWKERMYTIKTYEQDHSASTRIIQWYYAIDMANQRPLFGNGFNAYLHQPYYNRFIGGRDANRTAHSNYFEVLGEQGYIGLMMFLALMATAFFSAGKWSKRCATDPELKWASALLEALPFSIAGYAFNGLTLNIAHLDLYYYILAFIALLISQVSTDSKNSPVPPVRKKKLGSRRHNMPQRSRRQKMPQRSRR